MLNWWVLLPGLLGLIVIPFGAVMFVMANPDDWKRRWMMVPGGIRFGLGGPMPILMWMAAFLILVIVSYQPKFT